MKIEFVDVLDAEWAAAGSGLVDLEPERDPETITIGKQIDKGKFAAGELSELPNQWTGEELDNYYQSAVQILEAEDPSTLPDLFEMAAALAKRGRSEQATDIFARFTKTGKRVLRDGSGSSHPGDSGLVKKNQDRKMDNLRHMIKFIDENFQPESGELGEY
jgi:hypothetical protein